MFEYDRLFIDGKWATPAADEMLDVVNPADEDVLGRVPQGTVADSDAALAAARLAFDEGPWSRMHRTERQGYLARLGSALAEKAGTLEELVIAESGVARARARSLHVDTTLAHLDFFTEMAGRDFSEAILPTVNQRPAGGSILGTGVKLRDSVGVVSAIVPYNAPFLVAVAKVGPALAMGNTVVLKPSPFSPLQAFVLAEAVDEVGFPPGVFNLVTGAADVGQLLSSDPRVDLVTFTGSVEVGAAVMAQASRTIKRVLLELGGKSVLIVRADADLDRAAMAGVGSMTAQAGQGCSLCTRHLVHRSVADEYVERVAAGARKVVLGNPSDSRVEMGPLIRESQRERVEGFVETAQREGATLVCGGARPGHLSKGYFYEPTVFADVKNESTIAQNEVFGPVAAIITYDTDEEAVRIANDSTYGLGGQIFSRDSGSAFEMARQIRTGGIHINGGAGGMSSYAPFGGIKHSGVGREYGEEGVLEFTEIKVVMFNGG